MVDAATAALAKDPAGVAKAAFKFLAKACKTAGQSIGMSESKQMPFSADNAQMP
jgi:hypothetical protein